MKKEPEVNKPIELPTRIGWILKGVAQNLVDMQESKVKALKKKGPLSLF